MTRMTKGAALIYHIPKAICNKHCSLILNEIEKLSSENWENFQESYHKDEGNRTAEAEELLNFPMIKKQADEQVLEYCTRMNLFHEDYSFSCADAQITAPNGRLEEHFDDTLHWGSCTIELKDFVVLVYLYNSTVDGEIVFTKQKKIIRPTFGDILIFPSGITHPHLVNGSHKQRVSLNLKYTREHNIRRKV